MNVELFPPQPSRLPEKPGFAPVRIARLIREAVTRTGLDLTGLTVLTEAATGAYGVTAPIAALAGARRVLAFAKGSRHGSAAEAGAWTHKLAREVGVASRVEIVESLPRDLSEISIVTNSGHLRPMRASFLLHLPQSCVLALMMEGWELRDADFDVAACRLRGIRIAAVNERHPAVDVFSYLGPLCLNLMHAAGLSVYGERIAVLCDNDFAPSILATLNGCKAKVTLFETIADLEPGIWDAVVVALQPFGEPRIGAAEAAILARRAPNAIVCQFWGDIDRAATTNAGLSIWPQIGPRPGHMAVLLSDIGPAPIVRLQSGGLRAAQAVYRNEPESPEGFAVLV
jgi:hypothetical protein